MVQKPQLALWNDITIVPPKALVTELWGFLCLVSQLPGEPHLPRVTED